MNSYRVRSVAPKTSEWVWQEASSMCYAIQDFHEHNLRLGVSYVGDPESPGRSINFMLLEADPGGEFVSRIYRSQIVRRGGVRVRPPTLRDIAEMLGWNHDPEQLVAPGWDGEEEEWT